MRSIQLSTKRRRLRHASRCKLATSIDAEMVDAVDLDCLISTAAGCNRQHKES
ncbi:hypothetical protein ACLOJK_003605, partial [Asimina triloba]